MYNLSKCESSMSSFIPKFEHIDFFEDFRIPKTTIVKNRTTINFG